MGQSIIYPPSHCPVCNRPLGLLDLIPFFNYLWLKGRCRYCQAPIPLRLPLVELITGLLFAFLYWNFGLSLQLGISLVYASLLIVVFVIDLENQLVLDKVVYPGMALALIFSLFLPEIILVRSLLGFLPEISIVRSLLGGALGFVALLLPLMIYRHGMGMGDVKLAALVGLMVGFPLVIIALLLSVIVGGLVAAALLILRLKKRSDPIPFAPFLAASAMVTFLWGPEIWQWYLF